MEPLCVYVVYDPAFEPQGAKWVTWLTEAFSGLGMQRDECRFGVPVQYRSIPWGSDQPGLAGQYHPRRIVLDEAASNCILLLVDDSMVGFREARWETYVRHLLEHAERRPGVDLFIPVVLTQDMPAFARMPQAIRDVTADLPQRPDARVRFLVQVLNALLVHRQPAHRGDSHRPGHGVFVSHAKRDGWRTAERIVQTLHRVGQGARPALFLDKDSLLPGSDYEARFEEAIAAGSLLALVTDAYHARPWCRWEVLTAKRLGRPILVADLSSGRVERTHPYMGNVPSQRVALGAGSDQEIDDETIELLTLALLSEALRFELWYEHAHARMAGRKCRFVARPPELADLADVNVPPDQRDDPPWIVYPDPPLGREEIDLLSRAFPFQPIFSLSQAMSRA